MQSMIPLSKLVADRRNPRRVKPEREAHKRLVASIRAHGLLENLVVRPENGHYLVIAGKRRLPALREVYSSDFKVPCEVREVDAEGAEGLSLAENFVREPMHPLDEADAFARMASVERKGVLAIAAEFGVSQNYVKQRMKLAGLCDTVKEAYRSGAIDTATAEAFAAVPPGRQEELWKECGGNPQHARHVRNLIEDRWIDASLALFDVSGLPAEAVSTDLFRQCVLIERGAFMQAQAEALAAERERLTEDGWSEVVIGERADLQPRLHSMGEPRGEFTKAEKATLEKLEARMQELQDSEELDAEAKMEEAEREAEDILSAARSRCSEATKSRGTVFLVLSPEGRVERHYRVPPRKETVQHNGKPGTVGTDEEKPPTANDLSDRQRAEVNMHEAIAVRQAVTESLIVRKRLLVLALHEKVTTDGIALRRDVNVTTEYAGRTEGFTSETLATLRSERAKVDPFKGERDVDEVKAYKALCKLSEKALDKLIEVLIVDLLTGHTQRQTELLGILTEELKVNVRGHWTPDAEWLAGYQKIQLADLIGSLRGKVHGTGALSLKKSELVDQLAALFSQAASAKGGFDDPKLAERVNAWLPREPD